MNSTLEILIIAICGFIALVFLVWYFYRSSRKQKCGSCSFYISDKEKDKKYPRAFKESGFKCPQGGSTAVKTADGDNKKMAGNNNRQVGKDDST